MADTEVQWKSKRLKLSSNPDGSFGVAIGAVRDDALSTLSESEGTAASLRVDANGALWVQMAGALDPATDAVAVGAVAGYGAELWRTLDADETEEDVKQAPGTVYGIGVYNRAASARFVKLYNATAAGTTVGTTTPRLTIPIQATSTNLQWIDFGSAGIKFDTAICVAATTAYTDADTGAPAANDVLVWVSYK